jgi:hypothetical protein
MKLLFKIFRKIHKNSNIVCLERWRRARQGVINSDAIGWILASPPDPFYLKKLFKKYFQ